MTRREQPDPAVRRRIEHELRHPQNPPRSRAAIAREHGVSARTVSRYAEALGIPSAVAFDTASIRAATISATDRRRALRSDLADTMLRVEATRILDMLARSGRWERALTVKREGGEETVERIREDDATVARGVKDLHNALGLLITRTLDIDQRDAVPDDTNADDTLAKLFDGLGAAYQLLTGRPVDADDHHPDDPEEPAT